jgi:hypothetical protein
VGVVQNAMPCSDLTNGQPTGSAVDLWEAIAQQQGWRYRFQPIATPNAAIEAAATGKVDVAICCLNIIAERLEKADFSVPYQEDSLAFLSRKTNEGILPLLRRRATTQSCCWHPRPLLMQEDIEAAAETFFRMLVNRNLQEKQLPSCWSHLPCRAVFVAPSNCGERHLSTGQLIAVIVISEATRKLSRP